ncbi:hypothetical protein ACPESV_24595 [Streptomyces umbrinus]|uniref:hypothetical protein n=1 Tax=Streptomyces umbrinus TaxID=67370 RepID=UPI003C2F8AF4
MTYIAPQFMTHAAPEAIEAAIRDAEATRDRYAKKVSVLRGLLATRHDQIAAGTWPPASEEPKTVEESGWCSFGEDDAPGSGCILPAGHQPPNRHVVTPGDADDYDL